MGWFIFSLGLGACQPSAVHPRAPGAPTPPRVEAAAESAVHKFCNFDEARCQIGDAMNWELRARLSELNVAATSERANFLKDWSLRYRDALAAGERRLAAQRQLIAEINRTYGCALRQYEEGEQMTFARELIVTGCEPLKRTDYGGAAKRFRELARLALPDEAKNLKLEAARFEQFGPIVEDLATLKQALLTKGIVKTDGANTRVKLAHIGHPFEHSNQVHWLEAYVSNVEKLSKRWNETTHAYPEKCLEPACDPEIYRLARAVVISPPLDWAFLRDGEKVVPPSPYALSYFGQRYSADSEVRDALGLNLQRVWLWNSELYEGHLIEPNTLSFSQLFPREGVTLTITGYTSKTEYPHVVPLLLAFQEARGVMDHLADVREEKNRAGELVRAIHELRFDGYVDGASYVAIEKASVGYRLSLRVLQPPEERPIEAVREEIYRELPVALTKATATW